MILYHGTTKDRVPNILSKGLKGPKVYLTKTLKAAAEYSAGIAEGLSDSTGREFLPVVIKVRTIKALTIDPEEDDPKYVFQKGNIPAKDVLRIIEIDPYTAEVLK
jgi:hypothetical protein